MSARNLVLNVAGLALMAMPCAAQESQNLSLADAEKIAIQNHPQIQAAGYLAVAAQARATQARSAYYPQANGSLTGAVAEHDSRISAGALNNPIIYDRYANGVTVSQLVTDFGRTHELVKSSSLHADAQKENVKTSRADVLMNVDRAYYAVLRAQAVLKVAEETVKTRQLVSDQITALEKNKLRSGLDVSFANVDLAQAQLLLIQAQNSVEGSYADLSTALGYSDEKRFTLVEESSPSAPPADVAALISQALQSRPELIGGRLDVRSAQSYATAERDLWLPTISAVGVAGVAPYHEEPLGSRYAAAGVNVNIPIFNGHQFGAQRAEADAQAQAEQQYLRDLQNGIVREVRKAWLESSAAFQRLSVTQQLLVQTTQALDLAQERYKLGLSSIIELSQAQLNMTQAEITQASAKYDYETAIAALNYQVGATH
jgi:outer membrane protein